MRRRAVAEAMTGTLLLGGTFWVVGWQPVLTGLQAMDPLAGLVAALVAVPATTACAWRWRVVARRLGIDVPWGNALAAYYRSTFLNLSLPLGVLGDVHRGLRHPGPQASRMRGLKAVAWERTAGQTVQVVVAAAGLLLLGNGHVGLPTVGMLMLAGWCGVMLMVLFALPRLPHPLASFRREMRSVVLAADAWPVIVTATLVATAGHVATFVLAARLAGVTAPLVTVLPLTLATLVGGALPTSLAGWGPREGAAAAVFAAAGLGAAQGLATAALYGVLVITANLPGAAVLLAELRARRPRAAAVSQDPEVCRG